MLQQEDDDPYKYLELHLPDYLKEDLDAFIEGVKTNSCRLDCYLMTLQASINTAYYAGYIDAAQADYIRDKYYRVKDDVL